MLNIKNKTPFAVSLSPQTNLKGHDVLLVFLAASCSLSNGKWHVSESQMESPLSDQMWDDNKPSSIRFPSQLSHDKPGTDVIVNAHAVAPQEKPVSALKASVRVGALTASVVAFGDRVWHNGAINAPRPFVQLPIIWETAFGGSSGSSKPENAIQTNEHNPLGLGWTHPSHSVEEGKRLPNIEHPQQLIRTPKDRPLPVGFGAIPAESPLRTQYAGTYDDQWRATRAPFVPQDFDPAFFYSAIPELRSQGFMRGDEPVRLTHLHPTGDVVFNLPSTRPEGCVTIGNTAVTLVFRLQTVVIEAQELIVRMFWQAVAPAPRSVADIKDISVSLAR